MGDALKLLLSPHQDDETLFAAYTCLRHRPKVVTVFDGSRKKHYAPPEARTAESAAAMEILGCDYEHLGFPIDKPVDYDWDDVAAAVRDLGEFEHVWTPLPEPGGHRHHNGLARVAVDLFGADRVSFYTTYRCNEDGWPIRTVVGDPVKTQKGWPELKRRALACYPSQSEKPGTAMHFGRPLDEHVVDELRLNLGGGINPIAGFVNLDKTTGWTFEQGLGDLPDYSVRAVTESHALMYVDPYVWPFVFEEIARVLVPGGTLRMTHDNIGGEGSSRPVIRPKAAVATTPELLLAHLEAAGFEGARVVGEDETSFVDRTLIQQNYGREPDVFHVEAVAPVRVEVTA